MSEYWKRPRTKNLSRILQSLSGKAFWGMSNEIFKNKDGVEYDQSKAQYVHPTQTVANLFRWGENERENNLLDRLFFIHRILGVTEQYFRDFWGDASKMPTKEQINEYFPLGHKDFPERKVIKQSEDKLEIMSVAGVREELEKKKVDENAIIRGKLQLIDGYQIYTSAGGKFEKDGLSDAAFLDTDAARAGRKATDVRMMLSHPEYKDAVFQDAATKYLLEGFMHYPSALLTNMLHGPVQGEETSISTAGRSFYLKYFEQHVPEGKKGPKNNIFDDFEKVFNELSFDKKKQLLNEDNKEKYESLKKLVKLGWYSDVAVTSGFHKSYVMPYPNQKLDEVDKKLETNKHIKFLNSVVRLPGLRQRGKNELVYQKGMPNFKNRIVGNIFNSLPPNDQMSFQNVNLALVAGHNVVVKKSSDRGYKEDNDEKVQEFLSKVLIDAAYELTLSMAVLKGKKKVVLTLVGAGAFAGQFGSSKVTGWILDTLKQDHIVDLISRYGLEVTLINYPDLRPHRLRDKKGIENFRKQVAELSQLIENKNKELKKDKPVKSVEELQEDLTQLSVELSALNMQI